MAAPNTTSVPPTFGRVHPEVERAIRELASSAKPTNKQIADVCEGWARVFAYLDLHTEAEQMREFNDTMKARVRAGIISVVADAIPNGAKRCQCGAHTLLEAAEVVRGRNGESHSRAECWTRPGQKREA
jgi:hypothetical protein